jgi:hypothetical protein
MKTFKDKLDKFNKEILSEIDILSNKLGEPCVDYYRARMLNISDLYISINGDCLSHINHKVVISDNNNQYSTLSLPTSKLCKIIDHFK